MSDPQLQKIIDAHPRAFARAIGRRSRQTRSLATDEEMQAAIAALHEFERMKNETAGTD